MQGTKGPSSLDLIEQAMAEIYRSRQANLAQKSRRYMEKLAKKAEKQKGGFGRSPKKAIQDDDDAAGGAVSFADDYDFEFESEADIRARKFEDEMRVAKEKKAEEDARAAAFGNKGLDKKKVITLADKMGDNVYKNGIKLELSGKDGEEAGNAADEATAEKIRGEFRKEVSNWWHKTAKMDKKLLKDFDYRGKYADYLTDKYMCQLLDKLQPGRVVSASRKDISGVIEILGSSANELPPAFLLPAEATSKPKQGANTPTPSGSNSNSNSGSGSMDDKKVDSKAKPDKDPNSSASAASSSRPSSGKQKEKLDKEKDAVKQQYAAFVAQKKNAEVLKQTVAAGGLGGGGGGTLTGLPSLQSSKTSVDKQSAEMEKQYESLNDDIKALISQLHDRK